MPLTLGIPLGDPAGIGPEVALQAVRAELGADDTRYVLFGTPGLVEHHCRALGIDPDDWQRAGRVTVRAVAGVNLPADRPAEAADAARAAIAWLDAAAAACQAGQLQGMVTAPLSKARVIRAGIPFVGQTERLSALANTPRTAMMLLGHDDRDRWLRVVLATTHVPLRQVADRLDPAVILQAIELGAAACRDLDLPRARVAVCGLNPHAGEGGLLGDEESRIIQPALEAARQRGLDVAGPLAGDAVFHQAAGGAFDAVVAMYHDQGLAPLKLLAFDTGVNWTLGLPFIRTSPDHGTAFDIAGKGLANPSSMRAAIQLARRLARRRHICFTQV